jgi:Family of unknown function (DUF6441)
MAAPTRELEKLIVSRKLAHGGNPVTRWMAANVAVAQDPAGNLKPAKDKSTASVRCGSCLGRADRRSWWWTACAPRSVGKARTLRGFRRATDRARARGDGLTKVVMFLLVPQVKLPKRLDVTRAAERWSAQLPSLIEQQLRSE